MSEVKEQIYLTVDNIKDQLFEMNDFIHDNPELGNHEFKAVKLLTDFLAKNGFSIEIGLAGLPTAFKATYSHLDGGPTIGFLCEYDALEGLGHACGHNLQGPSIIGAAIALVKNLRCMPAKIIVFGTPAEETTGEKVRMANAGLFDELDLVLSMHAGDRTDIDNKLLALDVLNFNFRGKAAHAAVAPEQGRSALDGVLLTFNAIEYLREHVQDHVRIHGVITNGGKAANIVPEEASAQFYIRANNRPYLDTVLSRIYDIVNGAALSTGTTVEIERIQSFDNIISIETLNKLLLKYASECGATNIMPREKTGSSDFSSVAYRIPGACLRIAFVPLNTPSHSRAWVEAGKTQKAYDAIIICAKALAASCYDLIYNPELLKQIKTEFLLEKERIQTSVNYYNIKDIANKPQL
jgi:amidohydrolase